MFAKFIKKIYKNFTTTNKPKIIPKNIDTMQNTNDDSISSEENGSHSFALGKRRSQIGNLITYRTRAISTIIYPEQEVKQADYEEPIDVHNTKFKHYTIKVIEIDVIKLNEYQAILKKYNEIKPSNWPPLEILERAEGGFQIEIPEKKNIKCANQNDKIKQLRWINKALICRNSHIGFNHVELQLLFRAMHSVLGDNVYLE